MSEWACGYILHFKDGGEPEEKVLCRGTEKSCLKVMHHLPVAVSYSGLRPIDRCEMVCVEVPAYLQTVSESKEAHSAG